jgi:hypothetical protein
LSEVLSSNEAAWEGKPFAAVKNARENGWQSRHDCDFIPAHSDMLSAYIGSIGDLAAGLSDRKISPAKRRRIMIRWGLSAEYHAMQMRLHWKDLNYGQLNVLASWLIRTAKFFPLRRWVARHYAGIGLAASHRAVTAMPHDKALACITRAKALVMKPASLEHRLDKLEVYALIHEALSYETLIREEADKLKSLRQLSRIFAGAGEVRYALDKNLRESESLLYSGLHLAEGEAQSPSQAAKIRATIRRFGLSVRRF